VDKIGRDTDRDFIMTASQAKEYGIIDEISESRQAAEELLAVASAQ
jgi:ATP-dependent Clp protease protease subunit